MTPGPIMHGNREEPDQGPVDTERGEHRRGVEQREHSRGVAAQ